MTSESVSRIECQESMRRIHERIDKMADSAARIETSANLMSKAVDKVCNCVYGTNGKDGIVTKITKTDTKIGMQWWLLSIMMAGLLGLCWVVIKEAGIF